MFKSKFKVVYDSLNDIYQVEERKWYSFLYWPTTVFDTTSTIPYAIAYLSNKKGSLYTSLDGN